MSSEVKTVNFNITLKNSVYFTRFSYEINAVIQTLNDITKTQDFYTAHKTEYENYVQEERDTSPPFAEQDILYLLNETLLCRIWDDFVLFLKQLILAAEMSQTKIGRNKLDKIDKLKFDGTSQSDTIKTELHRLKICPSDQPQWGDLKTIKVFRNKTTHSHRMKNLMLSINRQEVADNNHPKVTAEEVYKIAKAIHTFAQKIDKEFLKHYPPLIETTK